MKQEQNLSDESNRFFAKKHCFDQDARSVQSFAWNLYLDSGIQSPFLLSETIYSLIPESESSIVRAVEMWI